MARAKRHYIPGQIWHTPVKQNKEGQYLYIAHFGAKKGNIGAQNAYVWNQNFENAVT